MRTAILFITNSCFLPFGLSSACCIFSNICRQLVNKWCGGEGNLVSMFLDGGFACSQEFEKTKNMCQEIKSNLLRLGFAPNATKSISIPVQILEYLVVVFDALNGTIYIPVRRSLKAKDSIAD